MRAFVPYVVLLVALGATAGCVRDPGVTAEDTPDLCQDMLDNDGDAFTDCDDQDCAAFVFCSTTGMCGDGVLDPGEECDNGVANGMGTCSIGCTLVAANCGDGMIDPGEQCDQGPMNSDTDPDRCRTDCQNPSCGDAVQDMGEECDDGALNSDIVADACRLDCLNAFCGDAVQDFMEGCDNGELNSDTAPDACRTDCQPYRCGDGVVDSLGGEGCDDGAMNGTPGFCSLTCSPPGCGDGVYDPSTEFCDAGNTGTSTCMDFGYIGGTLGCTMMCGPDVAGCNNCGNAIIDGTEDCDGAALGGETCMTVTGAPGTLACASDCTYDTGGCLSCGNGTVDAGEECDGLNLDGETCSTIPGGFSGGTLVCDSGCMFDTVGCTTGACDVDSPATYLVTPTISDSCAFGAVSLSIGSFIFSQPGGTLTVSPVTASTGTLSGPSTTCPSGSFTVDTLIAGGCCETYTLTGTYIDADTWAGTFTSSYCEDSSCGCCDMPGGGCLCPAGSGCGDSFSCSFSGCSDSVWSVTGMR